MVYSSYGVVNGSSCFPFVFCLLLLVVVVVAVVVVVVPTAIFKKSASQSQHGKNW